MIKKFGDRRDWFLGKRLGMFIHWGVYAVGGVHEQELWRYGTPREIYYKYAETFNPRHFDPAAWLDMIQENGMEYLVFTAKHHDGFCLWDTAETSCNVMNTPFKKDIFRMLAEECHKRDFPLVVYYSVVDWHHPAYPNIGRSHEVFTDCAGHDVYEYVEFVKRQLREICCNYGELAGIWWDVNTTNFRDPSINALIREWQPGAVINNRGFGDGDFSTPERVTAPDEPFSVPTEACESVGRYSWGVRAHEDYYYPRFLKRKIAINLALGGNFLLNAGADANGVFTPESRKILADIGCWYRKVRPALTAPLLPGIADKRILCTGFGRDLYLILSDLADSPSLPLDHPFIPPLESAELLNDATVKLGVNNQAIYPRIFPAVPTVTGVPEGGGDLQVIKVKLKHDPSLSYSL